jgi:serine/threonine-protein kinase
MTQPGPIPVREGDLLAGKYRVERVLGVGGMGIVVAAMHEQLEQRVAIKFVRNEALGNDEAVGRFLREARAAVKLRSEHAAKVLDVGTLESGAPYMVMEFLEGNDLGHVLAERGPLPAELAAEWVVQACEAVAEAHAAGIVHRDLKPQNLFLARTVGGGGKIKVLDFGVSKSLSTSGVGGLTQTRSMLGSPLYMSPEQMRSSRDVDARSDVWALGVVLFELLTQRWPFEAETMPELCLKVVTDPPQSLAALRPDVPKAMVEVVERCLQREPDRRYANAAELASALEPLAPPASRVIAERARMAMGNTSPNPNAPAPSSPSLSKVVPAGARTGPTPSAWGSGKRGSPGVESAPTRKRGPALWIALGAAGAAAVGVSFFLLRGHAEPAPPPPAPPTAVAVQPPPPATAATSAGAAGTAPAPTASDTTPPPMASSPPSASASPPKPNGWPARNPAGPVIKPRPKDDDIPSLR